jgi:hypothetical protein
MGSAATVTFSGTGSLAFPTAAGLTAAIVVNRDLVISRREGYS